MKKVTLSKIEHILENLENEQEVLLAEDVIEQAKNPLEQMLVLAK